MRIKFNNKIKSLFKEFNIYTKTNNDCRFSNNDILKINEDAYIEEFSSFIVGNTIYQSGSFSYSWSPLPVDIRIGRYCSIGPGLKFYGNTHDYNLISTSPFTYDKNFSIFKNSNDLYNNGEFETISYKNFNGLPSTIVENDVWIGSDVKINAGIRIGTGSVIGANSLVNKDVPPYAIVGGVPAKIIKYRFDEMTRGRLLASGWWRYNFSDFKGIDLALNINKYLNQIERKIKNEEIELFVPKKLYLKELI